MSVQIILEPHNRAEFILPKFFIQTVLKESILAQALEGDPDVEVIPIPNRCVTPEVMQVLVNLSLCIEPIRSDCGLAEAAKYLNCERLLIYSSQSYNRAHSSYGLQLAIKDKSLPMVKYLLQKGHQPSNMQLMLAIEMDVPAIIRLLLTYPRVNTSWVNTSWYDFWIWVIDKGTLEHLQILLTPEYKIDPTTRSNVALRHAIANRKYDMALCLLADPRVDPSACKNEAIFLAASRINHALVEGLMQHPKVDPSDENNRAIKIAIKCRYEENVRLLMQDERVVRVGGYTN